MKYSLYAVIFAAWMVVAAGCSLSGPCRRAEDLPSEKVAGLVSFQDPLLIIGTNTLEPLMLPVFQSNGSCLDALVQLNCMLNEQQKNWRVQILMRDTAPVRGNGVLTNITITAFSARNAANNILQPFEEGHLAKVPVRIHKVDFVDVVRLLCEISGMSATICRDSKCVQFGPAELLARPVQYQWRRYVFDCTGQAFRFANFPPALPFVESGFAFDRAKEIFVYVGSANGAKFIAAFMAAAGCGLDEESRSEMIYPDF